MGSEHKANSASASKGFGIPRYAALVYTHYEQNQFNELGFSSCNF